MNYEGWILTCVFMSWAVIGAVIGVRLLTISRYVPVVEPDPIELEARHLAEIEVEELCRLIMGDLEPVKRARVMIDGPDVTPEQRRDFLYGLPERTTSVTRDGLMTYVSDARAATPLVLVGRHDEIKNVTWLGESFCLGCYEWTKEPHCHQFNMMGECAF